MSQEYCQEKRVQSASFNECVEKGEAHMWEQEGIWLSTSSWNCWNHGITGSNPKVQASFKKGKGTRDPIDNICWIIEKAKEFQKNIYFCFIDYIKTFDYVDHNKLWKILKEIGIPDYLTGHLRNLHAGREATVKTRYGTTDWFKIGKAVHQRCKLSSLLI